MRLFRWCLLRGFMNLRSKLLIGYLTFIAALVVLGGLSARRLRKRESTSTRTGKAQG